MSGIANDTQDPDDANYKDVNEGFIRRQNKYCSDGDVAKMVPLSGGFTLGL